jgi:hypothetical protein
VQRCIKARFDFQEDHAFKLLVRDYFAVVEAFVVESELSNLQIPLFDSIVGRMIGEHANAVVFSEM